MARKNNLTLLQWVAQSRPNRNRATCESVGLEGVGMECAKKHQESLPSLAEVSSGNCFGYVEHATDHGGHGDHGDRGDHGRDHG